MATTIKYKAIAIGLAASGVIGVGLSLLAYWGQLHSQGLSLSSADWGTFGDFIGGFSGTLIGLATLIALAITLHLQGEELAKTSDALDKQARAANDQLKLTREIELRRIRPMLKAEWHGNVEDVLELRMKNVGLGAAIVDRVELFVNGTSFGEIRTADSDALVLWEKVLLGCLEDAYEHVQTVSVHPFGDLTRALAPTEYQFLIRVELTRYLESDLDAIRPRLQERLEPLIFFRSLAGQEFTTRNQYELEPL